MKKTILYVLIIILYFLLVVLIPQGFILWLLLNPFVIFYLAQNFELSHKKTNYITLSLYLLLCIATAYSGLAKNDMFLTNNIETGRTIMLFVSGMLFLIHSAGFIVAAFLKDSDDIKIFYFGIVVLSTGVTFLVEFMKLVSLY